MLLSIPASFSAPIVSIALAAWSSWFLLKALIPLLRHRLLDQPNARSSHNVPTPRGGGLAVVLVAVAAIGLNLILPPWLGGAFPARASLVFGGHALTLLPLMALPLALIGLLDDRLSLPASWRYGAQALTALLLIQLSPLAVPWWAWPLLLIAVTAVINFTNFMDGLDGLVAGCLAVAFSAAALQLAAPWSLWALVGALLGFLVWNWSPAQVFMGDVGSTFLGAVFAGVVLQASGWTEALTLLLVATPLLADACLCVIRRALDAQPVFRAHRLHLYQRLQQAGWSHARVAGLYVVATVLLAMALQLGGWRAELPLALLTLLLGLALDQRVAVPFAVASSGSTTPTP